VAEDVAEATDATVRVAVLGPVAVRGRDGALVEPSGLRAKALLAALALSAPKPRSVERLVDEVWEDDPPRAAKAALQTLVSRMRSSLGDDLIESLPSGYRLAASAAEVDLRLAEELLDDARAHLDAGRLDEAATAAEVALELWRGDPGADLDVGSLSTGLADRAARVLGSLEELLARAILERGRAHEAEEIARRLCARAPFDDSAHLLLMRSLDALGRSTEAVAVYADFRERVADSFGTLPAAELQALNLRLLEAADPTAPTAGSDTSPNSVRAVEPALATGTAPGAVATASLGAPAPAPRRAAAARGIRAAPNALLGRDRAIADIERLLAESRVATILGPGGLGKTRVAHEVAARALERFGAVIVVELASVRSGDDVIFAIGSALGIREASSNRRMVDRVLRADLRTRIVGQLADAPTLLVMDNCEHVIDAAADWASGLTAELPGLTVLTTSRTPLAISSERVFALAPLGEEPAGPRSDPAGNAAVRLFIDRATAVRPDAVLPVDAVARLCTRLDGLPLAIELAAARVRTMSLDEIERRLSNRFVLLAGGDRSAPERHRTLLAVIEWSWNLLSAREQDALSCLSEFADGFSAEAACVVVSRGSASARPADDDDVRDLLDGLVAQSLIMMTETDGAGMRYRMLETVREFGQLQLDRAGTRGEVQDALFVWAVALAERLQRTIDGPGQIPTFRHMRIEEDNLIDLLRRAMDADRPDVVAAMFALLSYYWSLRSAHSEVVAFSKPVFEAIRGYEPVESRVLDVVGALSLMVATNVAFDFRFALRVLSRLRAVRRTHAVDDPRLEAMSSLLLSMGDAQKATELLTAIAVSPDKQTALFGSLMGSAMAENDGKRTESIALARRASRLADEVQDTWGSAMAGQMLGMLYSQSAQPEESQKWAKKAQAGLAALGATEDLVQLEWVIALNNLAMGADDDAEAGFLELLTHPVQADGLEISSMALTGLAEIARARGRTDEAKRRLQQVLDSFGVLATRMSPWYRVMLSAVLSAYVTDGMAGPAEQAAIARRIRARTLANSRQPVVFIDRPILGACLVGLAVWMENGEFGDDPRLFEPHLSLELLAMAESLSARQDPPALRLAPLFERFALRFGADEVERARRAAEAVPHDERPERAAELLRTPGPWSPTPVRRL
jgi:predicted ATPase/DNA-binding SARP family transcriptional activator